jgi:coenzyme F420-reducing hydrogenase delta subunit
LEALLRGGAGGVLVLSCPPRDCRGREGPKWLEERVYRGREAELQDRVDRRRIKLAVAAPGAIASALAAYHALARAIAEVGALRAEELGGELDGCDRTSVTATGGSS